MISALSRLSSLCLSAGLLALALCPSVSLAQTGASLGTIDNICLAEARRAEAQHGIPRGLLQSITRVEAGRRTVTGEYMPWAWTLNDRGDGLFFDDRDSTLAYLRDAVASPDHSVDVGCMQVNTKWHGDAFADIADMLDPVHNADYAAGFLLDLHAAHQSWDEAVKHYHSAEPGKNVVYHRRVLAELERYLDDNLPPPSDEVPVLAASLADRPVLGGAPADGNVGGDGPGGHDMMPVGSREANNAQTGSATQAPDPDRTELALMTRAPTAAADIPSTEPRSTETLSGGTPAAVTSPNVTTPDDATTGARPAQNSAQNSDGNSAQNPDGNSPDDSAGDALLEKQPNLAPHRHRVEHFRRLLAAQAG